MIGVGHLSYNLARNGFCFGTLSYHRRSVDVTVGVFLHLGKTTCIRSDFCLRNCRLAHPAKCCGRADPPFSAWELIPLFLEHMDLLEELVERSQGYILDPRRAVMERQDRSPCPACTATGCFLPLDLRPALCRHYICQPFAREVIPRISRYAEWQVFQEQQMNVYRERRRSRIVPLLAVHLAAVLGDKPLRLGPRDPRLRVIRGKLAGAAHVFLPEYDRVLWTLSGLNGENRELRIEVQI